MKRKFKPIAEATELDIIMTGLGYDRKRTIWYKNGHKVTHKKAQAILKELHEAIKGEDNETDSYTHSYERH